MFLKKLQKAMFFLPSKIGTYVFIILSSRFIPAKS